MKEQVRLPVAVHILDMAGPMRLRAVAAEGLIRAAEADSGGVDRRCAEGVGGHDRNGDHAVRRELYWIRVAPRLDVDRGMARRRVAHVAGEYEIQEAATDDDLPVRLHHEDVCGEVGRDLTSSTKGG